MNFTVTVFKTRLDKFLVEQLPEFSRSKLQKDIEAGCVSVSGVVQRESKYVVRKGDLVEYIEQEQTGPSFLRGEPRVIIKTLYDANGLLIIDKPAGISVHPGAGVKGDSLSDLLLYQFPEMQGVGESHRPGIVHRLDKDTSGVMLVAKTQDIYEYLKDAFAERKVKKEYIALVGGVPEKAHGFIDSSIGRDPRDFRKYTTKNPVEPKASLTEYRVLEVFSLPPTTYPPQPNSVDKTALISVNLHTGRTHQIRVHMASVGHPLMGDVLYGRKNKQLSNLSRQFLHARRIEVQLPDGAWIEAESELAEDLRQVLISLDSKAVNNI